jgi:hypothetical protein
MITMTVARRRLALLWFVASGLVFLLVLAASVNQDAQYISNIWAWFLPSVIPTLALIIGVLIAEHGASHSKARPADRFLLNLSTWLSAGYLGLIALSLVFVMVGWITLTSSQLYLAPFQGLTATALSAFFLKQTSHE